MATLDQLSSALVKADAAGNVDDARMLASEIRRMKTETTPEASVTVSGADSGIPVGRQRQWSDVPVEALTNVVPSAINMAGGVYQAVSSPIETLKGMRDVAKGAIQKVLPEPVADVINKFQNDPEAKARAIAAADAVGGFYKDRYGSEDAWKKTMATDPVGFAADLSTLLSAGSTASARVAPTVSNVLATGAKYSNPMAAITPVVAAPVKAGGMGINYARKVLNPKTNALVEAAGGQGPEIVNALRNAETFVAGAPPTAGEIAATTGSTLYPALQKNVTERISAKALAQQNIGKEAIKAEISALAKTPDEMDLATKARAEATAPLYTAIENAGNVIDPLKVEKISNFLDETVTKKPGNEALVSAFNKIKSQLVDENNVYRTDSGQIASILDGLKTTLANTDNKFIRGQLNDVKAKLIDAIPGYAAADAKYAEMSMPINKMQVAQYLKDKLIPALEGKANLKAEAFATALKDAPKTIERSTGIPRYQTLAEMFTPDELQVFQGINKELQRESKFAEAAAAGTKEGVTITPKLESANLLNRVYNIAHLIMAKLQGRVTEKIAIEMAVEMLDPARAANSLEKALASQAKAEKIAQPFKELGAEAAKITSSQPAVAAGQLTNALQSRPQQNQNALAR